MKSLGRGLLVLFGLIALAGMFGGQDGPEPQSASVAASPPPPPPVERVRVTKQNWTREGFGNVAEATIWIENANDYPVRDVTIECDFYGASETRIQRKREVIFQNFPAKKTTRVSKLNLGFIDQQVKRAGCQAVGALRQ